MFNGLNDLKENFDIAWQLISSVGVKEKHIFNYLTSENAGIPNKLSSKLTGYPASRYPSEIQATLRQLSELFIQDVAENEELEERFFSKCYCESGALSKYALLSKKILDARYAALFSCGEKVPHIKPVKEKKNDNVSPDILSEAIARRPIVLLGDVGVGKTSFVKNLMYNSAYAEFRNAIYIYIDLGSNAALTSDIKGFVLNEIESQILEKYKIDISNYKFIKGVYASDIYRFSNGIWGEKKESDPSLYETKLLEHLEQLTKDKGQHLKRSTAAYSKSSQRQIIISLDNADQRDYEIQQSAFIISQELAKEWSATVFISVRPQTFFKSKRSGALSAYPHKIFTISPPRIDSVIEKRLLFALDMAEGKMPLETINYVRVNAANLALFIKALLSSLKENNELYEFLSNITGGNIRSAIEFVTSFIGSPNVDANKIIDIMANEGRYTIPLHEFTKSVLFGDYSHYSADTSIAMNIFDVSTADQNEHFLVPIIISFLEYNDKHKDNDGFCKSQIIIEEIQNLGFTVNQITSGLRRATNKKIIETSQRITFEEDINGVLTGDMPDSFRITTIGAYHLKRWLGAFTYLDAMVFDTPIFDPSIRSDLNPSLNLLSIDKRFDRAILFRKYLLGCWSRISNKPDFFNFEEYLSDGEQSFLKVKTVIEREP